MIYQFGIDNEPVARELYSKQSGIDWREVGMIQSEIIQINTASPDGLSPDNSIVLEIKCTRNLDVHLQRFFEGIESQYMNQIMNYFVVADEGNRFTLYRIVRRLKQSLSLYMCLSVNIILT